MFILCRCGATILLAGFCWAHAAPQKSHNGLFFPAELNTAVPLDELRGLPGFLSGCFDGSASGRFQVGIDFPTTANAPVYALSNGRVIMRSSQKWSDGKGGLMIRHQIQGGPNYDAVYENIKSDLTIGTPVLGGQQIGTVAPSQAGTYLHLAIIPALSNEAVPPTEWDTLPCSRWGERVKYANPIDWIGALAVPANPQSPCDLNHDGVVDGRDVELTQLMALKRVPCTADLDGDGVCGITDLQRVVNASNTGHCRTGR